ncbi:MAG: aminotransferase class V-fold PLP-dependent enzyme, partial [Candidatus Humimicrobiaceae bacterium]
MSDTKIFFDNASTTKVDPRVLKDMLPYFSEHYGNPSSLHDFGDTAHGALDNARSQVASLIGANDEEIYFTSCGTESNNLALWGLVRSSKKENGHIITSAIEHHSIINPLKDIKKEGWDITHIGVDNNGLVDPDKIRQAITDSTLLISIMHANNEVGTRQNLKEI